MAFSDISEKADDRMERMAVLWYLPSTSPEGLTERLRADAQELGVTVTTGRSSSPPVVGFLSLDTPFFELFEREVHEMYGADVVVGPLIGTKAVTDCRFLRAKGIDCYGMWPFPVTVYDSAGIHGVNERLRLDWFLSGVTLMEEVVLRWVER